MDKTVKITLIISIFLIVISCGEAEKIVKPGVNILRWTLKTDESEIVKSYWTKTIIPGEITSYVDSRRDPDDGSLLKNQFIFVNKKLAQVSITYSREKEKSWEHEITMLTYWMVEKFGDPRSLENCMTWDTFGIDGFIWAGYKDGSAWANLITKDSTLNKPLVAAIGSGKLQLIY